MNNKSIKHALSAALLIAFGLLAVGKSSLSVSQLPAESDTPESGVSPEQEQVLRDHIGLLNEFSGRRRVNTFFPNEQSAFHGVAIRYVNTATGNLSFVRRDLVTVGRLPIVLARVYDSERRIGSDFGPGWHLSLAETIEPRGDGSLVYLDDSASELTFVADRTGHYTMTPPGPSNIASVEVREDRIRLTDNSGWTKTFRRSGERFHLTRIRDPYDNTLTLRYNGEELDEITTSNGRFVSIQRDASGRVVKVVDDQARTVSYAYNPQGQLSVITDLGDYPWRYEYDRKARLRRVIDPRDIEILIVAYDDQGQVADSRILGTHDRYEYRGRQTHITDADGRVSVVSHSPSGLVTSLTNPEGLVSQVQRDAQHRIATLLHDDAPRASFAYDPSGQLTRLQQFGPDGSIEVVYDEAGQLRVVSSTVTGGATRQDSAAQAHSTDIAHAGDRDYQYTARGELLSVTRSGQTFVFTHNADGQIETIQGPAGPTRLSYQSDGKLESIMFPDGAVHHYQYDTRGLRQQVERSDGTRISYDYDEAGNLIGVERVGPDGAKSHRTIEVDSYNRMTAIEPADGNRKLIDYDAQGNPQTITYPDQDTEPLEYLYDRNNRVIAVRQGEALIGRYHYTPTESDLRLQMDRHTKPVAVAAVRQSASIADLNSVLYTRPHGSNLGPVRYDEATRSLEVPANLDRSDPDALTANSLMRQNLLEAARGSTEARLGFDSPMNMMFLPGEYMTINCEVCHPNMSVKVNGLPVTDGGSVTVAAGTGVSFAMSSCAGGTWTVYLHGQVAYKGVSGSWYHTFSSPGTYSMGISVACSCQGGNGMGFTVNVVSPPPTSASVTTSAGIIGHIDRNLNMPTVQFSASVTPSSIPVANTTFHWYLKMAYTEHGKNFVHRVPPSGTVNVSGSNTWQPAWGNLLAGGNEITVYVSATANGATSPTSGKDGFEIHGENPTQAQLFAQANLIEARAVMWQESTHRQFKAIRYSGVALPLWGTPDGWGLMQRDPLQSEAQLWNWQTSLQLGISHLNDVHSDAQAYLNFWSDDAAGNPDPADDWLWNPRTQFPDRVWDDAFARYNTGGPIYTPNGHQGIENCDPAVNGNPAGCNYKNAVRGHINNPPW